MDDEAFELICRDWFHGIGVRDGWQWPKVERLAARTGITPDQLLIACGCSRFGIGKYRKQQRVPRHVAMLLYQFWMYFEKQDGREPPPLFGLHLLE